MLVLSRRPDEKVVMPSVPAIIKVISSQAGLVRLGFEAPAHVSILREELCRNNRPLPAGPATAEAASTNLRQVVRNGLHNFTLGLALLRLQLGDCDPVVRQTLDGLEEEVQALRRQITSNGSDAVPLLVGPVTA